MSLGETFETGLASPQPREVVSQNQGKKNNRRLMINPIFVDSLELGGSC